MQPFLLFFHRIGAKLARLLAIVLGALYLALFSFSLGTNIINQHTFSGGFLGRTAQILLRSLIDSGLEFIDNCIATFTLSHTGFLGVKAPLINSLILITLFLILASAISIPIGMILGYRENSPIRWIYLPLRILSTTPDFILAILFYLTGILVFGVDTLFVVKHEYSLYPLSRILTDPTMAGNYILHISMPLLTLLIANGALGNAMLIVKTKCKAVQHENFITVARAKGISERALLWRHSLRHVLTEYFSFLSGRIPHIIGSLIVVEFFFNRAGLGSMLVSLVKEMRTGGVFAVALVIALISAVLIVFFQMLVAFVDPRWNDK